MALDVKQPKGYRKAWNGSPRPSTTAEVIERVKGYLEASTLGYTDRYERAAEEFYRETGYMAPGKSVPMEMAGSFSEEDRSAAWDEWHKLNLARWQQDMRDVIAILEAQR